MYSIRESIGNILDIPAQSDSWEISDIKDDLVLVNAVSTANLVRYGGINAVVVDIKHSLIVSKGDDYMPTLEAIALEPREYDSKLHLKDAYNTNIDFVIDPENTRLDYGFEGVTMHVFLHDGHVYHCVDKRLDSPYYKEIYDSLGGPSDEELFDSIKTYSPFVHRFILVTPEFQVASKTPVGAGYLIYRGYRKVWSTSPIEQEEIDEEPHEPITEELIVGAEEPQVVTTPALSLEEAEAFLHHGFHELEESLPDPRLLPGEFVIAHSYNGGGELSGGGFKIASPGYLWRKNMLMGYSDLMSLFYILSNGARVRANYKDERASYQDRFPLVPEINKESLELPMVWWPPSDIDPDTILATPETRLYNIWLLLVFALPLSKQQGALDLLERYYDQVGTLIDTATELWLPDDPLVLQLPTRLRIILREASLDALKRMEEGSSYENLLKSSIGDLIRLEEGSSLYRIVSLLKL